MNMKKTSLPIKYWNDVETRIISPEDDNGRKVEIGYFFGVQFTGHSIHYPQPLIYSHYDDNLILPTKEMFMSLGRGTVYEDKMEYDVNIENTESTHDGFVYYFVYNTTVILIYFRKSSTVFDQDQLFDQLNPMFF